MLISCQIIHLLFEELGLYSLDESSRAPAIDTRQPAISGGRKLLLGSQLGSILEIATQAMQKRIAVNLVAWLESNDPRVEAINGMLPAAMMPSAAWSTLPMTLFVW